jgi:hypothetical protein
MDFQSISTTAKVLQRQMQPILGMLFLGACRLLEIAPALGVNTFSQEDQDLIVDLFKRTVGADDQ